VGNKGRHGGLDEYVVRLVKRKARQLVGRAGFVEADVDDIQQELMLDLLRRLPRLDPTLAKRETFIARLVEHGLATLIESREAGIRDFRRSAGSLDGLCGASDDSTDNSTEDGAPAFTQDERLRETVAALRREEELHVLRLDLEKAIARLPVELRTLCIHLQTSSVVDISLETGVPRGTVYEAVRRLRTRFAHLGFTK
jgi:RNA polymerase sigma-70 factor (ECF subfamily)